MDTLKEILAERLRAPLFGYIAVSWISYNWSILAILFMSDYPILSRIQIIKKMPFPYLNEVLLPVLTGILLTIAMPYVQWALSKTQFHLDSKRKLLIKKDISANHQDELTVISFKAELDTAYELEKAKRQLTIAKLEEEKTNAQSNSQSLLIEKESLEKLLVDLNSGVFSLAKEKKEIEDYIINSLYVIDDMFKTSTSDALRSWKLYLKENFSKLEIDSARTMKLFTFESNEQASKNPYEILEEIQKKIDLEKNNN